jgi:tetratricopeptide (TPR) repeat protein
LRAGGLVLSDLGHYESALKFIDEALRLRPSFIEALIDHAISSKISTVRWKLLLPTMPPSQRTRPGRYSEQSRMLGRLPEAGTDLAKALRSEPRFPQAWSNRGNLFLKLQQPEAARAAFEKAITLRPGYV